MPLPVVAIDVEFPAQPAHVQQMLESCNTGAGNGACVSTSAGDSNNAPYLAYVSWLDDAQRHALIELGPRHEVRGSFEFRRLQFTEDDQLGDRFSAIGLTVASLVGSEQPEPAAIAAPKPAPPTARVEPWRLGVAGCVGSGFERRLSAGLELGLAYQLPGLPLFPVVMGGWRTATQHGITGQWAEVGVGLGAASSIGPLRVGIEGLVVGQLLRASATRDGESDQGQSTTTGIAAGLELALPKDGPVAMRGGAQVLQVARPTEVESPGLTPVITPRTSYSASLGLEVRF